MTAGDAALWRVLAEEEIFAVPGRLRVSRQAVALPDGRVVPDYLRLAMVPFVTVFALTRDGKVICERQYKHGPGRVALTAPAGAIEPGEAPEVAARRELLEETGYVAESWRSGGRFTVSANSAINTCEIFLAAGCTRFAEPNSGDLEDMAIELLEPEAVIRALATGEVPVMADALTFLCGIHALSDPAAP